MNVSASVSISANAGSAMASVRAVVDGLYQAVNIEDPGGLVIRGVHSTKINSIKHGNGLRR